MVESGLYGTPTTSIGRCWICKPEDPSSNPIRDIIFVSVTVIYITLGQLSPLTDPNI